ncbi:MAG: tRNA uridine-5-carboxymethylaminomethyl(34) synthesis enzyme MnmG [Bacteroidales bacterium]|nr:tRNA uridine-5-carboxymethylaminomethyl(34) synthesis enzyme MnmG [Bacteroidales bacterium]
MAKSYDIIVIGAGHAGCEAAATAAKMGCSTLLITMDMNKIAQMSCNPAVGGIAKGQIVKEIDALGGSMGLVTDASTIQFRMLNSSKGPAVWSPRAQCDRQFFILNWRWVLEHTPNLHIWQDTVSDFIIEKYKKPTKGFSYVIKGVKTSLGAEFTASKVILTAGTFLSGKMFIGRNSTEGGRVGEPASLGLTESLAKVGIESGRMKTGTPPRIDIRSVNLGALEVQKGDENPMRFSFLNVPSSVQMNVAQKCCYLVHTNKRVHSILEKGFKDSPLFSGKIKGIGPRYCPSIEDKLRTFAGKDQHLLFLEPEGWNTNEYYLQGFSSSLPMDIQMVALRKIEGFESVEIYRPAYAVEYDYFPPTQLNASLESKQVRGLYFAGQVNGTTGYEEAAAQGLMAGLNAALSVQKQEPLVLSRNSSYIGVLIDDLITKGVDEPYRMFTSRAEFRILLRQDNADQRLTPIGHKLGLATEERYRLVKEKYTTLDKIIKILDEDKITPAKANKVLKALGSDSLEEGKKASALLNRPEVSLRKLLPVVPRGTEIKQLAQNLENNYPISAGEGGMNLPFRPAGFSIGNKKFFKDTLSTELIDAAEIAVKYRGYIAREQAVAERIARLERLKIPQNFDFTRVTSLSMEARQKLMRYKPATIAQASRISGVSPADISVLLVYFGR